VFLNSRVAITFDQSIDPASATAATVSLTNAGSPVSGRIAVNGATVVFAPSTLAPATTYLLTVTTGVRSLSGIPLAAPFTKSFTTGTASDTTAPTVVTTNPANGATGVTASAITVTFSKPVDITTVTPATFTVAGGGTTVGGSFTMSGVQVIFHPAVPLSPITTYQTTVGTGVTDLAGNPLASSFTFTFTTGVVPPGAPPQVVGVTPANGATAVAVSTAVTATFNETVDAATVTGTTFTLANNAGAVSGTVSLSGTVATFQPASPLAAGTRYTATVTTGVKNTAGVPLAAPFTWSFTTTGTAPSVTAVSPLANATGVATNATLTVTFDRAMDLASVTTASVTLVGPGGAVAGTVTLSGTTAVFAPNALLAPSTTYTATVAASVRDTTGAPLAAPFTWSFTTGTGTSPTPPTVTATFPANGAVGVPVTSPAINATFNTAMNPATINRLTFTLSFAGVPVQGTVTLNGTTASFTPLAPLQAATLFTATITTGAQGLTGTPLSTPFTWSFTTQ
jgi:hypothetical protein